LDQQNSTKTKATELDSTNDHTADCSDDCVVHFILNLPETSIEFLDAFRGLYTLVPRQSQSAIRRVRIHVYAFSSSDPPEKEIQTRVIASLGVWPQDVTLREVRDVSPSKSMYCVQFTLPRSVAQSQPIALTLSEKE